MPTALVLTDPLTTTGSPVSAVAPASTYTLPSSTMVGLLPFRLITGGVESLSSSPKRLSRTTPVAPTAKIFSMIFNSTHIKFNFSRALESEPEPPLPPELSSAFSSC